VRTRDWNAVTIGISLLVLMAMVLGALAVLR
jgi:hypothetical protein